jgi:DNA repair protein RAD5
MQIIYCDPTEAEKDFYEALFKRSKVFFFLNKYVSCNLYVKYQNLNKKNHIEIFHITLLALKMVALIKHVVEQGRVLHNDASILELLLCLRQCCDHPFLVMRCGVLHFCYILDGCSENVLPV